ncbi:MAG: hypothetical protein FJX33_08190 [Alphaproteobacteria bacterium]|nr:hypothetical protein [Alphaproteobacteria bacterium]
MLSVYSMLIYFPFFVPFFWKSSKLTQIPTSDLPFQGFYQGVLMGALTMFSLGRSTMLLGAPAAAMSLALLPVATFLLAFLSLAKCRVCSKSWTLLRSALWLFWQPFRHASENPHKLPNPCAGTAPDASFCMIFLCHACISRG